MAKKQKEKKDLQDELRDSAHKIWLAGLGALSVAESEGTKLFNRLVKEGEGFETRGKKELKKVQDKVEGKVDEAREAATSTWDRLGEELDDRVGAALKRLGVPSRHEIQRLTQRVEELTEKVDGLKPKAPAKKAKSA